MRRHASIVALAALAPGVCLGLFVACSEGADPTPVDPLEAGCRQIAVGRDEMAQSGSLLRPIDPTGRRLFGEHFVRRSIDGAPRDVLPGIASREISYPKRLALPASAAAPVRWRIPIRSGQFPGVERFVVVPRVGIQGVGLRGLSAIVATAQEDLRGRFVEVEVDLAGVPPGRGEASLAATLLAAPEVAESVFESAAFALASGPAWLEIEMGILEAGRAHGPVAFRLEVCGEQACTCLHEEILDPARVEDRGWRSRAIPLEAPAASRAPAAGSAPAAGRSTATSTEPAARGVPAASRRTLRFVARALESATEPRLLLGEWGRPRLLVPDEGARAPRRNLILVSLDTLRADHLGLYGYTRDTSPFMDGELAAASTVFEQAVAPATATGPSHMTMFTGLSPAAHGVTSNLSSRTLPDSVDTLASVLRDRGYATGSINENGALSNRMGFDRGFDHHRQFFGANVMRPKGYVAEVFREGVLFLERHPAQRFFLFLHTYEVHAPYAPPPRYRKLFPDGDDRAHPDNQRVVPGRPDLRPVHYDREIRHVDTELERLFEALESGGWLDDTVVVITSDHGEAFGEHGTFGHGNDVYQETVHVPLVVLGPGIGRGVRIAEPVGLIDLMPTVLDWLDVPAPSGIMGRSFAGLLASDAAGDDSVAAHRTIVTETWAHEKSATGEGVDTRRTHAAYRRGRFKLIREFGEYGPRDSLFDLESDPAESRDLLSQDVVSPDALAAAEALRAAAESRTQSEGLVASRLDAARAGEAGPAPTLEEMSPERLEALRMLGYVE